MSRSRSGFTLSLPDGLPSRLRSLARGPREVAGSLRRCPACAQRAAGAKGVCSICESTLKSAIAALPAPGGPLFWLGAYAGPWLRLVRALKYEGDRRVADLLGGLLATRLLAASFRPTLITHVPASPGRLQERGFDQSELLAAALATSLAASQAVTPAAPKAGTPAAPKAGAPAAPQAGAPAAPQAVVGAPLASATTCKLLTRTQGSRSQGRLSRAERTVNAGTSFAATICRAQRVLLVDDVITTGATTAACIAALENAGAAAVWTAVVARTTSNSMR